MATTSRFPTATVEELRVAAKNISREKAARKAVKATIMSTVEPEAIHWLWKPYIPKGMLTLVDGDPGVGKGLLDIAVVAAITQGKRILNDARPYPDDAANVVLYTAEDSLSHILWQRLTVAGADLSKVVVVTEAPDLGTPDGIEYLTELAKTYQPALVSIDPIQAFIGGGVDTYKAQQVRPVLMRMIRVSEVHDFALKITRHFSKDENAKALYRGKDSIDFAAAARSMLQMGKLEETRRGLVHIKSNVGPYGKSLVYEVEEVKLDGFEDTVGRFKLIGESSITAEAFKRDHAPTQRTTSVDDAEAFLLEFLSKGAQLSTEVFEGAHANGISKTTLKRAKQALGVTARRDGGKWVWALP